MIRKKPQSKYRARMKYNGTQQKRKKVYFHNRRNVKRLNEIEILCRDVDYYLMELHKLEVRTGLKNLTSPSLRNFAIRLRYLEDRHHKYDSDYKCFLKIGKEFDMKLDEIRRIVFDIEIEGQWWLTQNEGGKEN